MSVAGVASHRGRRVWQAAGLGVTFARAAASLRRIQDQPPDRIDIVVIKSAIQYLRQAIKLLRVMINNLRDFSDFDLTHDDLEVQMLIVNYFSAEGTLNAEETLPNVGRITNALLAIIKAESVEPPALEECRQVMSELADVMLRHC